MTAALRALLHRLRGGWRLFRLGLDRRREVGWRATALSAARLLTGGRGGGEPEPALWLSGELAPPVGARLDVIYAVGYWHGEPKRYRVFNRAEGLRAVGYRVHVMPFDRLEDVRRYRWRAHALVLFRAEYDRLTGIDEVLAYARAVGIRVVYDIDDLVFDPALARRMDGLRHVGRYERRAFVRSMARMRRLLLAADLVTVSTPPLAGLVRKLGRPAIVVANSLSTSQLRVAEEIAAAGRPPHDGVRVAYLSGTRTHQRDFAECEAALLALLARRPEVRFRIVGYLDLGPQWHPYADRIERVGFLAALDMLRSLGDTDINLAPLELGNPFCEAKSELKFFEAALLGVPTVASPTETFAAAIEHGVTGLLAGDADEWARALEYLAASESRRAAIGAAAKASALARYAPTAITPLAIAALGLPPASP